MATLTRQEYFEAALDLLALGGPKLVTVANLCERLHVTQGSYYHHFSSRPLFLQSLLEHWESTYGNDLVHEAMEEADLGARIEMMKRNAIGLRHEAESAIRELARTDQVAHDIQQRVDANRIAVLRDTYREAGLPEPQATRMARIGVSILVGAQQTERPVDRDQLAETFEEYQHWVLAAIQQAALART